jgi:hypothetical protein
MDQPFSTAQRQFACWMKNAPWLPRATIGLPAP